MPWRSTRTVCIVPSATKRFLSRTLRFHFDLSLHHATDFLRNWNRRLLLLSKGIIPISIIPVRACVFCPIRLGVLQPTDRPYFSSYYAAIIIAASQGGKHKFLTRVFACAPNRVMHYREIPYDSLIVAGSCNRRDKFQLYRLSRQSLLFEIAVDCWDLTEICLVVVFFFSFFFQNSFSYWLPNRKTCIVVTIEQHKEMLKLFIDCISPW